MSNTKADAIDTSCAHAPQESSGGARRTARQLAVLIPVFNAQEGLERSLASLARDGASFDVFVVDDGSDPPMMIPAALPFSMQLIRLDCNRGITAALNAGLAEIASRDYTYVARLDAGDLSLPGRFAAQLAFLERHPDHAVVGTATRHVDIAGPFLYDYRPPQDHARVVQALRYRAALVHPTVMMRVQALRECGGYRDTFPAGEDYDLFMRLARTHKLANLEQVFVIKEISPDSITAKKRHAAMRTRIRLLAANFDPWSIHAYLGIVANLALMAVPRQLVLKAHRLASRRAVHSP